MAYAKSSRRSTRRKPATRARKPAPARSRRSVPKARQRRAGLGGQRKIMALNQRTVQRGYSPFGNTYLAKLPYCEDLIMTTSVGGNAAVVHRWRLNGMADPNQTGAGHQPRFFDQLTPLYGKYRVHGAFVSATFNDPGADGIFVGVNVYNSVVAQGSVEGKLTSDIRERKLATVYPLNNSGTQHKTISFYVPIAKIMGQTAAQYTADLNTGAAVSGDPVSQAWLETFVVSPTQGAISVSLSLKITYYVTFGDYKAPEQS